MPSVYQLKSGFQGLLRPFVRGLARAGITANGVTLFALALSIATGLWLAVAPDATTPYFAYPVVLFIRMALNAVDGMLAREFGQKTKLGAFLNELGDVLSDAALFLPLAFIPGCTDTLAGLFVTLAIATEVAGLVAPSIGASRRYDGPMGKSDRAFWIGAFMMAAGIWNQLHPWLDLVLTVLSALCLITVANRVRKALHEVSSHEPCGAGRRGRRRLD